MKNFKLAISAILVGFSFNLFARESVGVPEIKTKPTENRALMSGCTPATAQVDLDINNVRAKLFTGGDMWWDLLGTARYYIPKPAENAIGPSSQFATSLWVGGYDIGGTLKVAAQTYRQTGNDYWPGPLTSSATTDAATCIAWDKFFKINKKDVETFVASGPKGLSPSVMDVINNWPATGPEGQPLAPYFDANNNGIYDPDGGDYPDFAIDGAIDPKTGKPRTACSAQLYGDQSIWWVFNDKGNVHTQTGGEAIGLEIQEQAFAFSTNDEINNMTFYKYKIINKSSFELDSTFFGIWDDADLGYAKDDYVGCDVGLGLGMCYNGTAVDGSGQVTAYGANPPAVGIDFFEGPYADPTGSDGDPKKVPASFLNYGDKIANNERLGMGKFVYYINDNTSLIGEPHLAIHYYGYLTATWKDNTRMTYGGNGHLSSSTFCNYMFPGASDPDGFGLGGNSYSKVGSLPWDETIANNPPDDRRFLESAGPFKLKPGAVNTVTIGVPWARATQGGNLASVALLKGADDKAQQLFNRCFSTLNGPTAPNLAIQELDRQLILTWSNPKGSNNYMENYKEDFGLNDSMYRFQGYQIYQLKDGSVGQGDLYNVDKARLVFQCDKTDGIKQIVNYTNDPSLSALVPHEMVNGADKGIIHSITVSDDKFATGDNRLVNHKTYYYAIVAYGYRDAKVNFSITKDYNYYIAGRLYMDPLFQHAAIPHIPSPETFGTEQNSYYGSGPQLKRMEGKGNGGNVLDITDETAAQIIASPSARVLNPVYQAGRGPVNIKVVDPLNVPDGNFKFTMMDNTKIDNTKTPAIANDMIRDSAKWKLENLTTGEIVYSETTIKLPNEQVINGQASGNNLITIPKWGISVNVAIVNDPGQISYSPLVYPANNGFLGATMTFADNTKQWLTGLADQEGVNQFNWIRSGTNKDKDNPQYDDYYAATTPTASTDPDDIQAYEKVLGGTWAPYRVCAYTSSGAGTPYVGGPAWNGGSSMPVIMVQNKMKNLASVDIIFTNDPAKWTRCPVIEEQEDPNLAFGHVTKLSLRKSESVNKQGLPILGADNSDYLTGMGWFPGYAINVETGERLNMAFGEDSWLINDNGNDMQWNPTSTQYANGNVVFGGKHYIYVFGHNGDQVYPSGQGEGMAGKLKNIPRYDGGKAIHDLLEAEEKVNSGAYKRQVFIDAMWVNVPLLTAGHSLRETDAKVRLRVSKAFQKYGTGTSVSTIDPLIKGASYFVESGSITYPGIGTVQAGSSFTADSVGRPFGDHYAAASGSNPAPSVLTTVNGGNPMYTFNTADLETKKNNAASAKDALALINVVPNPYYAYSAYEKQALDNIVKITNLPTKCNISIYTLSGTLIKKFRVDQSGVPNISNGIPLTSVDWDLKNTAKVPVASGLYIIYVDVPGVGERTLKWFGVMRAQDLDAY